MKTFFKEGMTVYWGELKGEVVEIENEGTYPIGVQFNIGENVLFTNDGRLEINTPIVLSLTPYTLNGFSQEPQIEKDTLVYFRDNEEHNWLMGFYCYYRDGFHYVQLNQINKKGVPVGFAICETENPLL